MKFVIAVAVALSFCCKVKAQCSAHPVSVTHQSSTAFPLPKQCMTALHDRLGRPYLYVAGKERGLLVYNVSSIGAPVLVDSVTVASLNALELMSVSQDGNYLYLALGNVFNNASVPGMAIVDVTVPTSPVLKSVWKYYVQSGGAGIIKAEGNYAYLGAMRRGLMIFDISDKTNPVLQSIFKPSNSFPNPTNPDSLKYNARGLAVRSSIVYLCDDAGGVRVINATNKSAPVETGHFSNPAVYNRPRAYNNLELDDTLLYVAVDYCGMEILSVADTANMHMVGWWNPWHCESLSNTWFNSPGHTNEIHFDPGCKDVFMSSGKSEINVVNVSNPASPDSCTKYSSPGGNVGVWGLDLYHDQVYACYIYVPLGIPFFSNWSGVKSFTWNNCTTAQVPLSVPGQGPEVYPNPAGGSFNIHIPQVPGTEVLVSLRDIIGARVYQATFEHQADLVIHPGKILPGNYFVEIRYDNTTFYKRLTLAY